MRIKRIIEKGEEIDGKRRDEEDMQDSLVVEEAMLLVKLPLVHFATCLLSLHLLLQGYIHQEEV